MNHTGKYIYGIIATNDAPTFGSIGISGGSDEVTTIGETGLAAIVSNASMDHYVLSRQNISTHTKVLETVMEKYTVLPMRFCTVAENQEEIANFLKKNSAVLKNMLRSIEGKVEIDIKILWKEMKCIYDEIKEHNKKIKALLSKGTTLDRGSLVHIGELVSESLAEKRAEEKAAFLKPLKKNAVDFKDMEIAQDEMILHSAFLVKKNALKSFETTVDKLEESSKGKISIHYVGPMAPFSFIDVTF